MGRQSILGGLGLALFIAAVPAAAIESRLGVGVHLWRSADDLWTHPGGGVRHDLAGVLSYQLVLFRPLKLQLDVEYFPNGFGGAGLVAVFPQGLIVVGDRWYGAVGAGWIVPQDQEGNISNVIYLARLGADFPLRPRLRFDVFAEQRAGEVRGLSEGGTDTVTFAMVLRLRL
jgi:hypothetical protein